jgi:hypothetical protein
MSISFALYELYYRFDATNPQENITIIELLMIIHKKEKNIIKRVCTHALGSWGCSGVVRLQHAHSSYGIQLWIRILKDACMRR